MRSIYGVIAGFLMSYLDFIQCAAVALSVMQTFAYIAFYASVIHLRHLLAIVLSSSLPKNIRAHLKYSPVIAAVFYKFLLKTYLAQKHSAKPEYVNTRQLFFTAYRQFYLDKAFLF